MSKIIVDQIAKNGGETLTLPAADGTSANQPVVTNGSGTLSFSTLSMPSADGTANKPLVTDGNGQLGFGVNAMPVADGAAGQLLITDGSGQLEWGSPPSAIPNDQYGLVATVHSSSSRQNVYSSGEWSSSGPWTTYYNTWQDNNSITQGWNMLVGDGHPNGGSSYKYINDKDSNEHRLIEYATQNRVGYYYRDRFEYDNSTGDYSGITLRALAVRNTTNSSITRTIYTSRTGAGGNYGGHSTIQFTPNANTYAGTTGGSWSVIDNSSYTSESNYNQSVSVTVPANTTIILVNTSGWWYQTSYRFKDSNMFYNLDNFFTNDESLVCDMRMTHALAEARVSGESSSNSNPHKYYNACAEIYGDR